MTDAPPARRGLVWDWSDALFGAVCAVPSALVMFNDVSRGVACAVGVIPAAFVGVSAARHRRVGVLIVGATAGISMVVGSVLAGEPWLAVTGIFVLAVVTAELARRRPVGRLAVTLALPLVGVGLSFTEVSDALGLAVVIIAGSAYAWAVSLVWPQRPVSTTPDSPAVPAGDYGIRLGLAGAIAAALGFALDLDHVGWPCAAALLVMRPSIEMTQLRSLGRVASVFIGAGAAVVFVGQDPRTAAYALSAIVVVTGAAATRTSRWYVTSMFTTFLVIVLLAQAGPSEAVQGFNERVAETAAGVALAYLFGMVVPTIRRPRAQHGGTRHRVPPSPSAGTGMVDH